MATFFSTLLSAFFNWFSMILGHVRRRGNLEPGGTPYKACTGIWDIWAASGYRFLPLALAPERTKRLFTGNTITRRDVFSAGG